MAASEECLYHPISGDEECTGAGFNWLAFLFVDPTFGVGRRPFYTLLSEFSYPAKLLQTAYVYKSAIVWT